MQLDRAFLVLLLFVPLVDRAPAQRDAPGLALAPTPPRRSPS
jgi:hypothetical protein